MRIAIAVVTAIVMFPPILQSQARRQTTGCQYQVRFDHRPGNPYPIRLSGRTRTESIVFHTERRRIPAAGSALHLLLQHSPNLDSARSFISVSLNYALLRSWRLDYKTETEFIIPIPSGLLKESNELEISVQHFGSPGLRPAGLWTEIRDGSFLLVRCEEGPRTLDLGQMPYPLLDPHSQREQRVNVFVPESITTETLEAMALLVANLSSRAAETAARFGAPQLVRSLRGAADPVLIVGTEQEQPVLRQLKTRMPAIATIDDLKRTEGVAALINRTEGDRNPILVVTGNSSESVLQAARGVFGIRSETPVAATRIQSARTQSPRVREWRDYIPPDARFFLRDIKDADIRIRPGERGAALIRLDATPDARFMDYGMQARLVLDLRQRVGGDNSSLVVFLNEDLLGAFPVRDVSVGSRTSFTVSVPGRLLRTRNTLKVVWAVGDEDTEMEGEGWLLRASEFYLPRHYSAALPDLALLKEQAYPFSLRADLSDTVIIVPAEVDDETIGALLELSIHLGRLLPTDNVSFKVRRKTEPIRPGLDSSHHIILEVERGKTIVQEVGSGQGKYTLKFTAGSMRAMRQLVRRFFSKEIFDRLEGDTVDLSAPKPVMSRVARQQPVREPQYLTRIEAWLRSNWLALPVILVLVSVVMFGALRAALNQYRTRSNGAV